MTFTTQVKDEVTKIPQNYIENISELAAIVRYNAKIDSKSIIITLENASVARRIYVSFKTIFQVTPKIIIRKQKRFKVDTLYILEIKEHITKIRKTLYLDDSFYNLLESDEEKIAFLRGCFLACGSISDPKKGGYHFELVFKTLKEAKLIQGVLKSINFDAKSIKRANKYMIYLKSSEDISDFLKLLKATNAMFYFEDIRIYRDHKNMVNRLNNCEIANQEKTISTGLKQVEQINYLKDNELFDLLDEKAQIVAIYRLKYPDVSFSELSNIITMETDYKIGRSGINHNFIKIKELVERHKEQNK